MLFEKQAPAWPYIDPSLFEKEREGEFAAIVISAAQALENSSEIITNFENFDPETRLAGVAEEFEGDEDEVNSMVGYVTGMDKPDVKDEEYDRALQEHDKAATTLISHLRSNAGFMHQKIVEEVGETEDVASEQAWTATWKKLHRVLAGAEGTLLAEVVGYIDGVIKLYFGETYRPMERDRGPIVSEDVAARTFYVVMENHVNRAIIGANRDEWTGYQ